MHLSEDLILYKHGYPVIKADILADAACITNKKLLVMLNVCAKALPLRRKTFFIEKDKTCYVTKDGIIQLLLGNAIAVERVHQRIINIIEAINEFEDKVKPPLSHELKIITDLCKIQSELKEQIKAQTAINKELSKTLAAHILKEDIEQDIIKPKSKKNKK